MTSQNPIPSIDPRLFDIQLKMSRLHALFTPHSGQILAGREIFHPTRPKKFAFLQCGRNFGKSTFLAYCAVRVALLTPGSICYIVFPKRTQAAEVLWQPGILQKMIPEEYLHEEDDKRFNQTDLRVRLNNDSFIKLEGADDPDKLRGVKPNFVGFDEFRDFKNAVYDVVEPNLGAKDAWLVIGSTPPDTEGDYTKLRDIFMEEAKAPKSQHFYLELPTESNPHYSRDRLAATKKFYEKRGEVSIWLREYMAKFIPGGVNAIFPMYHERRRYIRRSHKYVLSLIEPDRKKLEWFCVFDPASNSTFAVLIGAVNRHVGQVYLLDELYERDKKQNAPVMMWCRAKKLKLEYWPHLEKWNNVYDEQAAWFYNDLERHGVFEEGETLEPTQKRTRDKNEDMSMIKQMMMDENVLFISEKVHHLDWEIQNYTSDEKGQFLKTHDHQIDNFRYLIAASHFEPQMFPDPENLPEHIKEALNDQRPTQVITTFDAWFKQQREAKGIVDEFDEGAMVADDATVFDELLI